MDVDGTFTDGTLFYDSKGEVIKGFSAHDGLGLDLLRRAGIKIGFVTGRHDFATEARATYLRVDFYMSAVGDKAAAMKELMSKFGLTPEECLFVGDDFNDIPAFETAGVKIAVANARTEIKVMADLVTKASGGNGAIREMAETVLRAKGIDPMELWLSEKTKNVGGQ